MAKLPQQRRAPRRVVDGVLFLDKPVGISSNNALQKARWLLNAAKGGHTGTLDPMASGLLPLTLGEATKFSQTLLDADKAYDATVLLGVTTTTADAEGEVLARCPVMVSNVEIEAAIVSLRGEIEQIPPMYSALKHHGKALYEYARAGVEIAREPRRVTIHRFEMLERDGDSLKVTVECSKGTYVRTLASDLGALLGCGAHLTALRRTRIGPFSLDRAISLTDLEALPVEGRDGCLAPVDALLAHLPRQILDENQARNLTHGQPARGCSGESGEIFRVYEGERFLGVATLDGDGLLVATRLMATGKQ
ncbi:MAG TPA: tRNA pseudouridine(55) synthase TruB [Zoogloea sp.]|uniref:tRNA pseudouridine(55) synthase TruB n=1 Tax=Zoogloea sp. TaxID=49181 RepID=UPI002B6A9B52|nr:tRNA pseudouridine(55) synthase TruB [Zoogloea sp.]HOB46513.1 tRNA pseudouridine(55) synthase TruB [Zoogloea sp.]HQA10722.1 tRNA pseudouridine(55) synthase TruB [Zoogloea sp.]HQE38597.1 tRNA pseudouridine(55) synthase TruB [Zoogloea sp.]